MIISCNNIIFIKIIIVLPVFSWYQKFFLESNHLRKFIRASNT